METQNIDELIAYLTRVQKNATIGALLSLVEVGILLEHLHESDALLNEATEYVERLHQITDPKSYETDPDRYEVKQ